ncbi:MAG TPA: undecaprenyl-diphosphate phosphatase [Steroidobacteraceae bacterium]|jgi:undecaprenyl-diphosphatase
MSFIHVLILGIVQGLAELLPVSSSAHVVVAEKLLGLDPSSPPMTLLLVMLHTGTMFAVIVFFWRRWQSIFFADRQVFTRAVVDVIIATVLTGVVGGVIIKSIEKFALPQGEGGAQIEDLFSHLELIAPALFVAGILILVAGLAERRARGPKNDQITAKQSAWIGAVQGLCLPFRGFSRSGATISTALLLGVSRASGEAFSFALAVVLTPPVVLREALRLRHMTHAGDVHLGSVWVSSLIGAVVAFIAGLAALRWLSAWLESGRWYLFGIYCLVASVAVFALHLSGY